MSDRRRLGTPEDNSNPREQLFEVDGLRNVILRTEVEPFQLVCALASRRKDDDRDAAFPLKNLAELEAVSIWQGQVEQQQIGSEGVNDSQCRFSAFGGLHLVPFELQVAIED